MFMLAPFSNLVSIAYLHFLEFLVMHRERGLRGLLLTDFGKRLSRFSSCIFQYFGHLLTTKAKLKNFEGERYLTS